MVIGNVKAGEAVDVEVSAPQTNGHVVGVLVHWAVSGGAAMPPAATWVAPGQSRTLHVVVPGGISLLHVDITLHAGDTATVEVRTPSATSKNTAKAPKSRYTLVVA